MVDLKKIDSFFTSAASFEKQKVSAAGVKERLRHAAKVAMPLAAAVLLLLIIIAPEQRGHLRSPAADETMPKKGELEKLHIEKADFNLTDKDNKISTFTADFMDETERGSGVVKITNPIGQIPLEEKGHYIDVAADFGYYHQAEKIVKLEQNVNVLYDKSTTVKTPEATYDFNKAEGYGDKAVEAYGKWGKINSEAFKFDKVSEVLYLEGFSTLVQEDKVLTAQKEVRYFRGQNKIEAEGNVKLTQDGSVLYADKLLIYLHKGKKTVPEKVEVFGNVRVENEEFNAKGAYGVYVPAKNLLKLTGNVAVFKGKSVIYGDEAVMNTQTGESKIITNSARKRVSGVIKGSEVKRK